MIKHDHAVEALAAAALERENNGKSHRSAAETQMYDAGVFKNI